MSNFKDAFRTMAQGQNVDQKIETTIELGVAAIETQVSSLKGQLVDARMSLKEAKENYVNTLANNGEVLTRASRSGYAERILAANDAIKEAQANLDALSNAAEVLEEAKAFIKGEATVAVVETAA